MIAKMELSLTFFNLKQSFLITILDESYHKSENLSGNTLLNFLLNKKKLIFKMKFIQFCIGNSWSRTKYKIKHQPYF